MQGSLVSERAAPVNPELAPLAILWSLVTGHPDAWRLKAYADSTHVPAVIAWAISWQESRHNINPRLRGKHGEWGRFQVMPSTARAICPTLDIRTYEGNVMCGLRYLRHQFEARGTWEAAVRAYQCPRCTQRTEYERSVMEMVGRFTSRLMGVVP